MYSRQWLLYSLIRVGVFAVALVVLVLVGLNFIIATIAAAVIGFCFSYIFLRNQRDAVAKSIQNIRTRKDTDTDNDVENEMLDRIDENLEGDGGRKP
ncbi:DUF4229 domain-containing protein [Glaciihabitans sp. UYNi722]|uniref:DUF4229 domain-containing protein n=1 Tax=Glaciihabitans sp. UYNi722 TaxID=3156344 RepID=UPI0033964AF4